jgi:peptidyl-dipeptidase A
VARIPFGLALQRWRWGVQSGRIPPERYNEAWWELVREYQGLAPPGPRPAGAFDPAAKRHIATGDDYIRYFLADVLTFQIHEGLARGAGCADPLHRCSAYGSREAGVRLRAAMAMGASRPWQDVLEAMTGSRVVRGEPLRRYLAPLEGWLAERTRDIPVGW